jgi:hypothetical protein
MMEGMLNKSFFKLPKRTWKVLGTTVFKLPKTQTPTSIWRTLG